LINDWSGGQATVKRCSSFRFLPVIGPLAFLITASIIPAQGGRASPIRSNDGSNELRKVKIKLVRDNGKIVTITQFVGDMITVKFGALRFGFVPRIDDRRGETSLVLHKIEEMHGYATMLATELETIPINNVSPVRSSVAHLPFSLILQETSGRKGNTERALATAIGPDRVDQGIVGAEGATSVNLGVPVTFGRLEQVSQRSHYLIRGNGGAVFQSGNCCVTCEGLESCGCAVEADCGSCCAPRCCGILD
jgi:hypothetical protein